MNYINNRIKYISHIGFSLLLGVCATNYLAFYVVNEKWQKEETAQKKQFVIHKQVEVKKFLDLYKGYLRGEQKNKLPRKLLKIYNDFILTFKFEPTDLYISFDSEQGVITKLGYLNANNEEASKKDRVSKYFSTNAKLNLIVSPMDILNTFTFDSKNDSSVSLIYILFNMFSLIGLIIFLFFSNNKNIKKTRALIRSLQVDNKNKTEQNTYISLALEKQKYFNELYKEVVSYRDKKNIKIKKGNKFISDHLQAVSDNPQILELCLKLIEEQELPFGSEFSNDFRDNSVEEGLSTALHFMKNKLGHKKIKHISNVNDAVLKIPKNVMIILFYNILGNVASRMDNGSTIQVDGSQKDDMLSIKINGPSFYISNTLVMPNMHGFPESFSKINNDMLKKMVLFYGYELDINENHHGDTLIKIISIAQNAVNKATQENILEFKRYD